MSQTGYVILTIALVVLLAIAFFVSFILYVRQPAPKGCEKLGRDESKCENCEQSSCRFYAYAMEKAAKKREEENKNNKGE